MFQKGTDPQVTQGVNGPFWGIPGHKQEFPGMWLITHTSATTENEANGRFALKKNVKFVLI